ncbi:MULTISPECIES: LacI family DNA-binding transcriptional regulator [Enterococcus]|uniref:Uncharacterized protein n=1 Tax=Enterococcus sulfureus ATCC 49903 TaxID=1140003 RepID=S0NQK1_9ENTE|nr:LacI family DNA-binding transcriptional regulator [Enterococcus sulfureus]EOT47126.1 hypothetical protein OMY_01379 [Enterococcus sulfureus ATCC 49903]EOT83579.1 hypothetical protein I573_01301 [Enterococcus sulfureus ATCC 49903]
MRPKLEDVAKLANVSKTTVSRVLNKRGYLSQETIDKVEAAMKELNYQPNTVARQLYNKKTNLIGLIFPTVANPFFGELVAILENELYQRGYKVIIGNSMNNRRKETDYLNQLLSEQVDGLIVGAHNQGIEEYRYEHLPIVAIDRVMNEDIPIIESDNYFGGKQATQLLIDQGAKVILHTNGPADLDTPAMRRRKAYEDTMQEHGLVPETVVVDFNITYEEKQQIFQKIFDEHPNVEGIFASNDVDAMMLYQIAQQRQYRVPEDLLIVGYDGTTLMRTLFPDLTTIVQPIREIALQAIQTLEKRLAKRETAKEYICPVQLHHGKTGFKKQTTI